MGSARHCPEGHAPAARCASAQWWAEPILQDGNHAVTTLSPDLRLTRDRLETLLRKMVSQRIVVVGDAMLDIYLSGEAERISPEAPVPVVTVHTRRYALGGAANVAANVAATGAECRLVAV